MERFAPLLLDVWREVCRHLDIAESVARLVPLLARRFPVAALLVRRIDPARGCVETVASGLGRPGTAALPVRSAGTADEVERALVWGRQGQVFRGLVRALHERCPRLLPAGAEGEALVAPLGAAEGVAGVLVLLATPGHPFRG